MSDEDPIIPPRELTYEEYQRRLLSIIARKVLPKGSYIHHIDGDPTNNEIENLRIVRLEENSRGRR